MTSKPNHSVQALSEISRLAIEQPIVSFDIFDTLVRRRFLAVNEVHDTVSAYLLGRLGRFGTVGPGRLTLARYNTGNFLKTSPHLAIEEPDLETIWTQVLRSFPGAAPHDEGLVRDVVRFEYDLELQNLAAVDGAAQMLARLKARGKRLIAVSDMYFPGAWIEEILTRLGLRDFFEHVFVSLDEGATKQTGRLFEVVLDRLGVAASDVMHCGDNPHSDIAMGRGAGLAVTHVDQHAHLHLERPAYGRRPDIHDEIADLVKLFLLHTRFHALNNRSDHLYFLSRDGLLLNRVWQDWDWPLLRDHLAGIGTSDLFLSRATSCWLALNFNADWLPQAIGFAFWLCHGRATGRQISDLLGIAEVPEVLGGGSYDSATQSDLVVQAYRRATLSEAIRASLLRKRGLAERYLDQLGFFEHRRVTLCDVGYSGTVARDLNSFFLQESPRAGAPRPPTIDLALIATNGNHAQNAVLAQPYVVFAARSLLESHAMPASLVDSYAWLEFFFKHPTYGPLLAYEARGDRVAPCFETGPTPEAEYPSETVLKAAGHRPEDVILLWMALTEHWSFLTEPLLARFAAPDLPTLRQMQAEIYEADAVSGRRRSVAAVLPDLSADEIYRYAKRHDYWIPGSILASARRVPDAAPSPAAAAPRRSVLRRVLDDRRVRSLVARRLLLRRVRSGARPFDPDFYRVYHPDLRLMDDAALLRHFLDFGIREGRAGTPEDLIARLERGRGPLPPDFDPEEYQTLHPDLGFVEPWRAKEHYLVFGRQEGRAYRGDFGLQDDEFAELVSRGLVRLDPAEQAERDGGMPVSAILFRRAGLRRGAWLHHLQVAEFQALNGGWSGPLVSRAHAVAAFLREGITRLAPLGLASRFDPAFHRGRHPELGDLDDEALYRHWLDQGAGAGEPPSAAARLTALVEQQDFPSAFRVGLFRSRHAAPAADEDAPAGAGGAAAPDDVDLLARFMDGDYTAFPDLVDGPGAARLWEVYARRARGRGLLDAARQGYENALRAGGTPGRIWHQIGDIDRVQGRPAQALAGFQTAIDAGRTDRWSYIEGAGLAARLGDFARALAILAAGRAAWADKETWRRARDGVLRSWFDHAAAEPAAAGLPAFLAGFRAAVAEEVPAFGPRRLPGHETLVVSDGSLFDGEGGDERSGEAGLRDRFGPNVRLVRRERRAEAVGRLPWASCLVLHEARADLDVIRLAEYARALGIPVLYWIGGFDGRAAPPFRGSPGPALRALLSCERARFAMGLCDSGVAPLPEALLALEALTRDRRAVCIGALARPPAAQPGPAGAATVLVRLPGGEVPAEMTALLRTLLAERPGLRVLLGAGRVPPDLLAFAHRVRAVPLGGLDGRDLDVMRQAACVIDLAGADASGAEAAALGLPCLHVGRSARPGADAFGQPAAGWRAAAGILRHWIDEPERRRETGHRARAAFEARYVPATGPAVPRPPTPRPERPRILFANVFFPPQTIGGATRVLKDNVDLFLEQAGDAIDFAVLTSDDDNDASGAARIDAYRGIPVFRIATPQEIDMDWRPHNPRVGEYAAEVIRLVKPDLVHIHCLQRLSVAVAEACEAAGVPYLVTLHDAWWLSDYSFLTDEDGRLCLPGRNLPEQEFSRRIGPAESLARGERLRSALGKARALLSVSEPFADLFRSCGFEARVVANGVSRLDPAERVPARGRVRLLHLGGTQAHKGAYLIEAALRATAFAHLELTIVNLFRDPGDDSETVWGTTPVRILGKVPSDRVAELYANADVLVAPSTWPESFGLVSREAAASGCWVVASRLGAMGEVVRPGENGFLVDVAGPDDLTGVLRRIDADPDRYTRPPAHRPALRTADDQGRELLEIYAALLAEAGR
ncbi:HAD-IA family hydrolase [Methylobacterium oryzihabitans]|uniref:Glycosyltransferase n=1 Tax=Methylobacterium oryzihabitans TaxID=2499852 RepID=A0A437PA33_9HYPH|nr:HAD-IA family hydrolase [Methylobacterium oryzihabitans]RVU19137.1 glycosyltransferase [Methylobacterium oryzihabitans]